MTSMSKLNPAQTIIIPPGDVQWRVPDQSPPSSVAEAVLGGGEDREGAYLVLMKWYPGWMSAPHTYVTDRLCVFLSGVWWCNSGPDFDPAGAVPVYPGGFVRRVAGTPHLRRRQGGRRRARGDRCQRDRPGPTGVGGPIPAGAAALVMIPAPGESRSG
jgi:hypothetical protein